VHEVVVVGAGPGGSSVAHFLARRGVDVLLLDRAAFPRDKTCGDGLTPRALRVLDQMGILPEVRRHGCPIAGYEVLAPNGRATAAPISGDYGALVVPRRTLDEIILHRAIASGARFEPRTSVSHLEPLPDRVRIHTEHGAAVEARTAVVATGAATAVLRRSGILARQPRALLAARAYFEDIPTRPYFQLRFDRVPLPGYGWIFPVGQQVANVGIGFLPKGRRPPSVRAAFERFARPLLADARQVGPTKSYPLRVDFLQAPTVGPRTLLVGEAAGLVNPLTGEGIDYALESGALAAEHIVRQAPLAEYDAALHRRFDRVFRFSTTVRDWYCLPPLLNVLVLLANRRPALRQALTEVVLGEREPAGYGPATMFARLVVYLLRTRGRRTDPA
jgi:geranylgeranyl reductase family protein